MAVCSRRAFRETLHFDYRWWNGSFLNTLCQKDYVRLGKKFGKRLKVSEKSLCNQRNNLRFWYCSFWLCCYTPLVRRKARITWRYSQSFEFFILAKRSESKIFLWMVEQYIILLFQPFEHNRLIIIEKQYGFWQLQYSWAYLEKLILISVIDWEMKWIETIKISFSHFTPDDATSHQRRWYFCKVPKISEMFH